MIYTEEQMMNFRPKSKDFQDFVLDNFNIEGMLLGLPMEEKNGKMIGTKNNLTKEQIKKFHQDNYVETDKGVYNPTIRNPTHFELRLRYTDNIVCLDVDGILENGDCCLTDIWSVPHMKELFLDCPYTLSRNKQLPHFYFKLDGININELSNTYVDCFKDLKGDVLFNHCWEKIKDNQMYNYNGELPAYEYEDIKHIFKDGVLDKKEPKPIQHKTFTNSNDLVEELLNLITNEYLQNYQDWCKIVWSAKNCGVAEDFMDTISQKANNYTLDGFNNVWKSSYPAYTLGTIKYYAKLSNPDEYYNVIQKNDVNFNVIDIHSDKSWANLFMKLCGDNFIFQDGCLYVYHNEKWRIDDKHRFIKNQIQETLIEFLNQYKKNNVNHELKTKEDVDKFKEFTKALSACMKSVCTISQINSITENFINILVSAQADLQNVFDDKPYMFCFANKSFDLQTGDEIVVQKEDYILQNTNYNYEEPTKEEYDLIHTLISRIFPNEEIRKCYLSVLFMGMTGIQVEKFFLANGCGRNGKGLINDLYAKLLGDDYFYKLAVDVLTSKSDLSKGASPQVANMDNKRCIISSEPDDDYGTKIKMNIIKDITGCNTINARQLYSSNTNVRMKQVQILECNKKPQLSGKIDESVMDRIVDIPFVSYFTTDPEQWDEAQNIYPLNTRFKSSEFQFSHRCALFKYILDNAPKELYIPPIIKERSSKFVMNNDELYDWFNETYELTNDDKDILKMKDVYKEFQAGELYQSKNKEQKRLLNYKGFIEYISTSIAFKGKYYNDMKKIDGVVYTERIIKYRLKENDTE